MAFNLPKFSHATILHYMVPDGRTNSNVAVDGINYFRTLLIFQSVVKLRVMHVLCYDIH